MSNKLKIVLGIIIIIEMILFYGLVVYADEIDDLKNDIKQAETELFIAEQQLIDINPYWFDIYTKNRYSDEFNAIAQIYLNQYRKEFFEYERAYGKLEGLLELKYIVLMNSINNYKEVK